MGGAAADLEAYVATPAKHSVWHLRSVRLPQAPNCALHASLRMHPPRTSHPENKHVRRKIVVP